MNRLQLLLIVLLTLASPVMVSAQDPHVHARYSSDEGKTNVRTDWLYLINTPQQFMELLLNAEYSGQQPKSPPDKVDLLIWSYSKSPLYKNDNSRRLVIKTDGESWSVDPKNYQVYKGESKNGLDIFWEEKRPIVGQPGSLSAAAQINEGKGLNGLFIEQIYFQVNLDQLLKIENAKVVEAQLGATGLSFSAGQLDTIRVFLSQIDASYKFERKQTESAQQASDSQAQESQETVEVGVVNGKAISLPKPDYPSIAKGARAAGTVNVLVVIDESGKVIAARAITGHPLLRDACEAAARKARFTPPIINGQPKKVRGTIFYNFTVI